MLVLARLWTQWCCQEFDTSVMECNGDAQNSDHQRDGFWTISAMDFIGAQKSDISAMDFVGAVQNYHQHDGLQCCCQGFRTSAWWIAMVLPRVWIIIAMDFNAAARDLDHQRDRFHWCCSEIRTVSAMDCKAAA